MKRSQTVENSRVIGFLLIVVGVSILVAHGAIDGREQARPLAISGYSEQIASEPAAQAEVHFSVTLHNPGTRPYPIIRIVPIVSEDVSRLILQEPQLIAGGDRIGSDDELTYHSRFTMNTSTLTEEQIMQLHPIIRSYAVTYGDQQEAVLDIRR